MRISVVIPLYNKERYVMRTLESVFAQTYQPLEIIVVDDGSTDGGPRVVQSLVDPRIRLIRQANAGAAEARNTGIREVHGDWIAFLDADDVWKSDNLESHVELLCRNPDVQWSAGLYDRRYPDGRLIKRMLPDKLSIMIEDGLVQNVLPFFCQTFLCTITIVVRKEVFEDIGYFDGNLRTAEDLDMWLRLSLKHPKATFCNKSIAEYITDVSGSLTGRTRQRSDILPHVLFVRKHLSDLGKVSQTDRSELKNLFQTLLRNGVIKLILEGNPKQVRNVVAEFRIFFSRSMTFKFIIMAFMPTKLISIGASISRLIPK